MIVDGPKRGETKQFLTVARSAETCGPIVTEFDVIVSVQHLGEADDAPDNPQSRWPDGCTAQPRPTRRGRLMEAAVASACSRSVGMTMKRVR